MVDDSQGIAGAIPDQQFAVAPMTVDEMVEHTIDFMEQIGLPLMNWQATAFRAIMGTLIKPDKPVLPEPVKEQEPQGLWGAPTSPSNPPWGGGGVQNVQPPPLRYAAPHFGGHEGEL